MKSVLKLAALPASFVVAILILVAPAHSHAQTKTNPPPAKPPAQPAAPAPQPAVTGTYTYVVQPGDSLTLLVRKSLQLYGNENKTVKLTPAGIIFAETNIVQKLGAPLLEVGQTITVDKADIARFAERIAALTPEQIAAWQAYANTASFDLPYVAPVNVQATTEKPKAPTPPPANPPKSPTPPPSGSTKATPQAKPKEGEQKEEDKPAAQTTQTAPPTPPGSQSTTTTTASTRSSNAPWYWWLVGAGTLGVLYYLLSGRQSPKASKK